jgi:hypothetical protein
MSGWITECGELWKAKAGCDPNWKRLAGELGRVRRQTKLPPEMIVGYFREYLYRTPIAYLSPTRFRETLKYWNPAERTRADVDRDLDKRLAEKERQIRAGRSDPDGREGVLDRVRVAPPGIKVLKSNRV